VVGCPSSALLCGHHELVSHPDANGVPDAAPPDTGVPVTVLTKEIGPVSASIDVENQDLATGAASVVVSSAESIM
jgi:hypothetical protein